MAPDDHDDLADLDEGLARALRAPGTADELADRERYLEIFRAGGGAPGAATPLRPRVHAVRRIGAGGALALALAVGGAGAAAAAWTGSLPEPLQRATHRVLGPVGVPPAAPKKPQAKAAAAPRTSPPAPSATPTASADPTAAPSRAPSRSPAPRSSRTPSASPKATASPASSAAPTPSAVPSQSVEPTPVAPAPTETPTDSATSSPTAAPTSPTAAPTPRATPAEVTISASSHRVDAGGSAVFTGAVSAGDGSPVARATVVLEQRGEQGWRRVSASASDQSGEVAVSTPPVLRTSAYRLRVGTGRSAVRSDAWRVVVAPTLTTTAQLGATSVVVSVEALGAQAGDLVRLEAQREGQVRTVARARLDGSGTARFEIAIGRRAATYAVVLTATTKHGAARAEVDAPSRVVVTPTR